MLKTATEMAHFANRYGTLGTVCSGIGAGRREKPCIFLAVETPHREDSMTESDTEFLSRMLSQSSMPQGQAADPDMTRLLALAAEAVSLREALGRAVTLFRESRVAHHTTRAVNGDIPSAQIAIIADIDTDLFRAALKKESKE